MKFVEFLQLYWREIAALVLFIISFVISLIKRKPVVNEMDKILLAISDKLPEFINYAETFKGAEEKKNLVLAAVFQYVKNQFSLVLPDSYMDIVSRMIEAYLSTPQKKKEDSK